MACSNFIVGINNDCNLFLLQVILSNPPVLEIVNVNAFLARHFNQVKIGSQPGILMNKISASYEKSTGFPEILWKVLPVFSLNIVWEIPLIFLIISPTQMPVIHN